MRNRKFLSLLLALGMLVSTLPVFSAQAAEEDVVLRANFDDLAAENAPGTTYEADKGSIAIVQTKASSMIGGVEAPSPETKMPGTSFTAPGGTDKAMQFKLTDSTQGGTVAGEKKDIFIQYYIPTSVNWYEAGTLVFSTNIYFDGGFSTPSNARLDAVFRGANNPNLFRVNNNDLVSFGQTDGEKTAYKQDRPNKKWFNIKYVFNTKTMEYDLYVDGAKITTEGSLASFDNICFPGTPETESEGKTVVNTLRLQVISSNEQTAATFYLDDMYVSSSADEVAPPTEEPTEEPTTPPTEAPVAESVIFHQISNEENEFAGLADGKNGGYNGTKGSYWLQSQAKNPITIEDAPAPETKMEKTNLNNGGTDKALLLKVEKGSAKSGSFMSNSYKEKDMYGQDKVTFSANFLIQKFNGNGEWKAEFRDTGALNNFFRITKDQFITYKSNGSGGDTTSSKITYEKGKWFNVRFVFDPKTREYDFYYNGEFVEHGKIYKDTTRFPGDPAVGTDGNKAFTDIRHSFYNLAADSEVELYIDDLFIGTEPVKDITVSKLSFTDGETELETIPADAAAISGKADLVYSRYTAEDSIMLLAALYDETGRLEKVWTQSPELDGYGDLAENVFESAAVSIPLDSVELTAGSTFKMFAIDSLGGIAPLTEAVTVPVAAE